jgi:hypothetical protein
VARMRDTRSAYRVLVEVKVKVKFTLEQAS